MPHQPTFHQFVELAKRSELVTIYRRLANDSLTPVGAFFSLDNGGNTFLLESVIGGEQIARYSFLAINPILHFEASGPEVRVSPAAPDLAPHRPPDGRPGDRWTRSKGCSVTYRAERHPELPRFCGGAVGYVSYDAVRYTEHLPGAPRTTAACPIWPSTSTTR